MAACQYEERLQASFKGVPFYVTEGGSQHGRRGAEGEFPFGEYTAYQDMGIKIRVFTATARFAGPTYIEDTKAFIDACESKGPGTLVHPTRGMFTCGCRKCDVREDYECEDGYSLVELEFVEAQGNGFTLTAPSGVAIDRSVAFLRGFLSSSWDATAVPFFAQPALVSTAAEAVGVVSAGVLQAAGFSGGSQVLSIVSDCGLAQNDQHALKSGENLSTLLAGAFSAIDASGQQQAQTAALTKIANWAAARTSRQSLQAAVIMENALFAVLRSLCAAYLARAAQDAPTTTLDKSLARITAIQTILNEEIAGAMASCDNGFMLQLRKLYADTVPALFSQAYLSPPLVTYHLNGALPSLMVAWEIYGDAKKFGTVETMNPFAPVYAVGPKVYTTKQ